MAMAALAGAAVSDESLAAPSTGLRAGAREAATLDRVHAAMLLQAGGRTNALRALLKAEQERGPDFLRLANALSALYPREPAQRGLFLYRLNVEFKREWDGRYYGAQQVAPVVAEEEERVVVVTVYTFFFQEGDRR